MALLLAPCSCSTLRLPRQPLQRSAARPAARPVGGRRQRQRAAALLADASLVVVPAEASEAFLSAIEAADQPAALVAPEPAAAISSEALLAAQAAAESDPTDFVFTALFTVAIAALSVVTLGVAYLSFTSWNDSRLEAADRARFDTSSFQPSSNGSSPAKKKAKAGAVQAPPEEFKGFGKK